MKPETIEDIVELLDGYIISAALGAAMELGVFWLLAEKPLSVSNVAQSLNILLNRCHPWLQLLCKLGLLEGSAEGYATSIIARKAILNAQSQDTWAFHAREDRDSSLSVRDLALNISKPMSTWQIRNMTPSDKLQQEQEDPGYVASFTRKLCEIHRPLAEQLANMLDLQGVKLMLDLGGGSGVVSFALLRKKHDLNSVVVDVEKVCQAGREIASENKLEKRITYLVADFLQDDLPAGFDMVMLCDVGLFTEVLFRKIYDLLNAKGRFVIVDKFARISGRDSFELARDAILQVNLFQLESRVVWHCLSEKCMTCLLVYHYYNENSIVCSLFPQGKMMTSLHATDVHHKENKL